MDKTKTPDERRLVTILFTDIVGSTTLAEKLDPEEWKEIVSGAHQRVSDAVTRYEGTVAQLLGDGVLAFFGAPVAHEDDPARAVRAGLDIQRAMEDYARELRGFVDTFQMRVGIHSGMVVAGAVGSAEHTEYLAVGDAVNLAARLQSAAQPGSVLISDSVARAVRHLFELDGLGEITVKGKAEPVQVYEVRESKAMPARGRGIEGLAAPLVGREREVFELQEALSRVRAGDGQIVFVLGEAGIGKSRLVEEARVAESKWQIADSKNEAIRHQPSAIRWLEGRTLSYGQALPFWLITRLIQNDLGLADGESEIRIKIALRRRVRELFGEGASARPTDGTGTMHAGAAQKSDELLPYLAHLMGVTFDSESAERLKGLDGETLKRQVLITLADYFTRLAQQQPTVLVLEDLHWADPSSREALERLLIVTERAPLMLLALMRAETDKPAWHLYELAARDHRRRFRALELEPLTAQDASALVEHLLNLDDLPAQLRSLILERAEGNPFYLEEIVRSLIEQGALVQMDGQWVTTHDLASITIPDTLQALLLTRIDHLAEDVKRTLQLASVIGRSFLYKLLEAISVAERELDWHLAQLERADLVREKERLPELEYMFKHALTQEAAYDSLVLERRREFHRRVGTALEQLFAERQEELLGLLAYHFDRAAETDKAIDYLIRAGDKARVQDAYQEAIQYYQRTAELLHNIGDIEREARTWFKLGLIYHAHFEFVQAHAANEKAFAMEQQVREQATRLASAQVEPSATLTVLWPYAIPELDPAKLRYIVGHWVFKNLFSGLVDLDDELNVIPEVARSWQVTDAGTRYLFHLRNDVRWTDGSSVTAEDFEWAWKRNLSPGFPPFLPQLLDQVVGARAFRHGENKDPNSIGVKALDAWTLEVQLERPVAFFPYVLTMPIAFPLHRASVQSGGDDWLKPPHLVSNGAYRLVRLDASGIVMQRNHDYFGNSRGNVGTVEFQFVTERAELWTRFLQGQADCVLEVDRSLPAPFEIVRPDARNFLAVGYLQFNPHLFPLDDVRVRRALAYALDIDAAAGADSVPAHGGMVHFRVPGHSPELNFGFDPTAARRFLAEAGYPSGTGFPPLTLEYVPGREKESAELARQWQAVLNVRVERLPLDFDKGANRPTLHLAVLGYYGDYPDADTFLRQFVSYHEWLTPEVLGTQFLQLVEDAFQVRDHALRMSMYREADRILVTERVLVVPLDYGEKSWEIALRRWVKDFLPMPNVATALKHVTIEPH